jgi:hypothetical protein
MTGDGDNTSNSGDSDLASQEHDDSSTADIEEVSRADDVRCFK